jgi:hypothetical protein
MAKRKINYWPLGILGLLGIGVGLTIWTIDVASKNPTYMDSAYLTDYRNVDKNINDLLAQEKKFDEKYIVDLEESTIELGQNSAVLKIFDKDMQPIENAVVSAQITRPHTTASDISLELNYSEDGEYSSKDFDIKDKGRWEIIYKIKLDNLTVFKRVKIKDV